MRWDKQTMKSWLKDQPEEIPAWKVVEIKPVTVSKRMSEPPTFHFYPYFMSHILEPYKRKNIIRWWEFRDKIFVLSQKDYEQEQKLTEGEKLLDPERVPYRVYYHLYISPEAAEEDLSGKRQFYSGSSGYYSFLSDRVIECRVPKKYITAIGLEFDRIVIVTRKFTIIGENKYFHKD